MKNDVEKRSYLGKEILKNCRTQLHFIFPYFDAAFASFGYCATEKTKTIGTDGEKFYFFPKFLLQTFMKDSEAVLFMYLHMLIHCMYLHPFIKKLENERLWDLACDLSAAKILQNINNEKCIFKGEKDSERKSYLDFHFKMDIVSPEQFYQILKSSISEKDQKKMEELFRIDDHRFWKNISLGTKEKWTKILSHINSNKNSASKKYGTMKGRGQEEFCSIKQSTYDYKAFLKKFTVAGEELELDMDSFDYIFYNYGIEQYGNMPLIEPLEYKEVYKMEELVIAIDTSGSCSKKTVQYFLEETCAILSGKENFFQKMTVYLVQCDCCIQNVQIIHAKEEWMKYSKNIVIQGRGGTDFTPVFRLIDEEKKKGNLKKLKALIYFSDGDGVYPQKQTSYETNFVFVDNEDRNIKIPEWITQLRISRKEE